MSLGRFGTNSHFSMTPFSRESSVFGVSLVSAKRHPKMVYWSTHWLWDVYPTKTRLCDYLRLLGRERGAEKRFDIPDDEYQSGRVAFYGLTVGYKKRLKKGFGLEFFIGAGLTQSWYKGYKGLRRVDLDHPDETVLSTV